MHVERDGDDGICNLVYNFSSLAICTVLHQFLTKVVAKGIYSRTKLISASNASSVGVTCHEFYKVRAYLSEYDITLLWLLLFQFFLKESTAVLVFAKRIYFINNILQANSSKTVLFR